MPAVNDMSNIIKHVVEPQRLLLTWQSLSDQATRTRFAVGELTTTPQPSFRYYGEDEFEAVNGRPPGFIRSIGYTQYPAFNTTHAVHTHGVVAAFMRRLPPRNRKDFDAYKQHFLIGPTTTLSDVSLLALTEARLPSDGFSFIDPLDDPSPPRELFVEVVGHRHYAGACSLVGAMGETADFVAEPENPHDPNAIFVEVRSRKVGYINRFQCATFLTWMKQGRLDAAIERMTGESGRPRLHLFVRVAAERRKAAA